jgi:dihydrofolate reductase
MRPDIVLVVAVADNGVIGRDGAMPWHLPADLRHFKRLTTGKPVIMGRKTFEAIGKPLPGRHNIVLTRDRSWAAEGVTVVPNLAEAIAAAGLDPRARAGEIMVVGGADPAQWREVARTAHPAEGDAPAHDFLTYARA